MGRLHRPPHVFNMHYKTNNDIVKGFVDDYELDQVLFEWATETLILQNQKIGTLDAIKNDTVLVAKLLKLLRKHREE